MYFVKIGNFREKHLYNINILSKCEGWIFLNIKIMFSLLNSKIAFKAFK